MDNNKNELKLSLSYKYGIKTSNIPDISSIDLIEYLEDQMRIRLMLRSPEGEIELLRHIIRNVQGMSYEYYNPVVEC